jgi:hypothetical protein
MGNEVRWIEVNKKAVPKDTSRVQPGECLVRQAGCNRSRLAARYAGLAG